VSTAPIEIAGETVSRDISVPGSMPHLTVRLKNRSMKNIAGFVLGVEFFRHIGNSDRVFEYASIGRTGVARQDSTLGPDALSEVSVAVPVGSDGQPVAHRTRVEYVMFPDGTRWDTDAPRIRSIGVDDYSRLQKALRERGKDGLVDELYRPAYQLWSSIRRELQGNNGRAYFSESMERAELPELIGTVKTQEGTDLVLSISDSTQAEVTLRFDAPMESLIQPGTKVTFKGVAMQFTESPFMLYLEVRRADVLIIRE
jgi:hypothetical protein